MEVRKLLARPEHVPLRAQSRTHPSLSLCSPGDFCVAARCCVKHFPPLLTLNQGSLNINHTRPQQGFSGVVFRYQICNVRTEFQHACFVFNYTPAFKQLPVALRSLLSEHGSVSCSCLYRVDLEKAFSRIDGSSAFFSEGVTLSLGERMPSEQFGLRCCRIQQGLYSNPSIFDSEHGRFINSFCSLFEPGLITQL